MRKNSIIIRQMRTTDVQAVSKMMEELSAFHGDTLKVAASTFITQCLGRRKLATVLLAFRDKQPIGFSATYDWMNFVRDIKVRHIDLIFVKDNFRHSGVGSRLVQTICKDAIKAGCGRVTVGAAKDNKTAMMFYQKLGFEKHAETSIRLLLSEPALKAAAYSKDARK